MFAELEAINARPAPFEVYTVAELWTDMHTSKQMLSFHLNEDVDYSSYKGETINHSVAWMGEHFALGPGKKIADFGCGPGLYAIRLARLGAAVTGIDFSQRSLQYAREEAGREGLDILYVQQNYLVFESQELFDLVIMISCDFCALSPLQRGQMLRKWSTMLAPGGAILLDVHSLTYFDQLHEGANYAVNLHEGFWSAQKYFGFLNSFKYEEEKVTLDKYTIVEADRTRTIYNWLQHFSPAALEAEFEAAGLSVEELYADAAGTTYDPQGDRFAVVARKMVDL